MAERWVLNRAGILNVYQYDDEVLSFAGGRLLLRGVNGSGKSTAMNMLLPFLLDGDTRKIDAAGEQSGVLKSWMLSGRDDAQPIGYLWIEFAKGEEYLTCGCGIRANRSSDSVSTWWWITPRRPAVDLDLVHDRRPLSAEALRAVLGTDAVFRHEDRKAYREEVRRRLFGGADLDQHIRLLHVVRNPRVGDRIDQELPSYLHDALPQLSEAALTDAAQPLDDLEEHRRNVAELARTASALSGLHEVYADYCRTELRHRAERALALVAAAEQSQRATARAETSLRRAETEMADAESRVAGFEKRERELNEELQSLRDAPAYTEGKQLEDLREHVKGQAVALRASEGDLARRRDGEVTARQDVSNAGAASRRDHGDLGSVLHELSAAAVSAGLAVRAPDLPIFASRRLDEELGVEAPGPHSGGDLPGRLSEVRAAAGHRGGDVEEVRGELRKVAATLRKVETASAAVNAAEHELGERRGDLDSQVAGLDAAVTEWREALAEWWRDLRVQLTTAGRGAPVEVDLHAGLADRRLHVYAALLGEAERLADHHQRLVANLEATGARRKAEADAVAAELATLDQLELPEPPAQSWQRRERGVVLAELVDFVDGVDEPTRAAIEAAMEAGGLLSAEIFPDGRLGLQQGILVAVPQAAAPDPLSHYLMPGPGADPLVSRILASISTDSGQLDREGATVITLEGHFRVGSLVGLHHKAQAEHIGIAARRANLERRRAEARSRLATAAEELQTARRELSIAIEGLRAARMHRDRLPSHEPVGAAQLAVAAAQVAEEAAGARLAERTTELRQAEDGLAEAVDKSRRTAANLGLVAEEESLAGVERSIAAAALAVAGAGRVFEALNRSLNEWDRACDRWQSARDEVVRAVGRADADRAEHGRLSVRLATIEEKVGVAYGEIVASIDRSEDDLAKVTTDLGAARQDQLTRNTALAGAAKDVTQLAEKASEDELTALAALPKLRRTLEVPGLLASVLADPLLVTEPVEESTEGLKALAGRLQERASQGDSRDVPADSVRSSLRQRRDSLGAGWDAEDRQPDESVPLTVEINGPEGRLHLAGAVAVVGARLAEMSALLSNEQDDALRNLLQGLVAREVAEKLHAAADLVGRMNRRLDSITTAHGIGVSIRWRRRDGLDPERAEMITLLAKQPDIRTGDEEVKLHDLLSSQLDYARREDPDVSYRDLVATLLDYRSWYEITILLRRPGRQPERLSRRTPLSEGEKKIVSYLPLFAAVAASCDSLGDDAADVPRFLLLDDAFAKVSEDNHPKLFGLLVELDLDFIATSERLWGTYATVPELAITEVIRDAALGVVVLEHSRWDGSSKSPAA